VPGLAITGVKLIHKNKIPRIAFINLG